jgi:phosphoserine phosphatase RsbU/P
VLDFARGHLGAGMTVNPSTGVSLQPVLQHVVDELRLSSPQRDINVDFDLKEVVSCDPARVAQMLSNLMANAVSHGATDGPVNVTAKSDASELKLVVCNSGEAIPREVRRHLFEPFSGELGGKRREGLGLGLYICAEIARAHGGRLPTQPTRGLHSPCHRPHNLPVLPRFSCNRRHGGQFVVGAPHRANCWQPPASSPSSKTSLSSVRPWR